MKCLFKSILSPSHIVQLFSFILSVIICTGSLYGNACSSIAPTDLGFNAGFGSFVSVSGDRMAVSHREGVYIFERNGSMWRETAQITPSREVKSLRRIAIYDDVLLVADHQLCGENSVCGVVYVYEQIHSEWVLSATLQPEDAQLNQFGASIALGENIAVIGASDHSGAFTESGGVYVYRRHGRSWEPETILTVGEGSGLRLGISVAIDGSTIIASSKNANAGRGAVYIFEYRAGQFVLDQKLIGSEQAREQFQQFGQQLSIDNHNILVAAPQFRHDSEGIGVVYAYAKRNGRWVDVGNLTLQNGAPGPSYGSYIALNGSIALVGDHSYECEECSGGNVSVFVRNMNGWEFTHTLRSPESAYNDLFGAAIALNENQIIIGSPGAGKGEVIVFDGVLQPFRCYADKNLLVQQLNESDSKISEYEKKLKELNDSIRQLNAELERQKQEIEELEKQAKNCNDKKLKELEEQKAALDTMYYHALEALYNWYLKETKNNPKNKDALKDVWEARRKDLEKWREEKKAELEDEIRKVKEILEGATDDEPADRKKKRKLAQEKAKLDTLHKRALKTLDDWYLRETRNNPKNKVALKDVWEKNRQKLKDRNKLCKAALEKTLISKRFARKKKKLHEEYDKDTRIIDSTYLAKSAKYPNERDVLKNEYDRKWDKRRVEYENDRKKLEDKYGKTKKDPVGELPWQDDSPNDSNDKRHNGPESNAASGFPSGEKFRYIESDIPALLPITPNPADNAISISYYLPQGKADARIILTTVNGKVIWERPIRSSGIGSATVRRQHNAGAYIVTLIVGNRIVATEKVMFR